MISEGKPAWLPWTSEDLQEASGAICKPLFGNANQKAGTTLARAIKNCPDCVFAALDLATGYVLATNDAALRDAALARMGSMENRDSIWLEATDAGGGKAEFRAKIATIQDMEAVDWRQNDWSLRLQAEYGLPLWDFICLNYLYPHFTTEFYDGFGSKKQFEFLTPRGTWDWMPPRYSLAEWTNEICRRHRGDSPEDTPYGVLVWLPGTGPIRVPGLSGGFSDFAVTLPVFVAFGLTGVPASVSRWIPSYRPARDFGRWLLAQAHRPEKKAIAVCVDRKEFLKATKRQLPTVTTWPTALPKEYGWQLGAVFLGPGQASVSGSFEFVFPNTRPAVGTSSQRVRFVPADKSRYMPVEGSVSVTITRRNPAVAWPHGSVIFCGYPLSDSTLSGGNANVPGSFAWVTPAVFPTAGSQAFPVRFTPSDSASYCILTFPCPVTIARGLTQVTVSPLPVSLAFGQTLADSVLRGGVAMVNSRPVPGVFTYDDPTFAPGVGLTEVGVTFTPRRPTDFLSVAGNVHIKTVGVKNPTTVTLWPPGLRMHHGEALSTLALSGVANVPGVFEWRDGGTVPPVGTASFPAYFLPSASDDYLTVFGSIEVEVSPAKILPSLTSGPLPAIELAITKPLSDAPLVGLTMNVPGTFAWKFPATIPPHNGFFAAPVVFTPDDAWTYLSAEFLREILVTV